jgi:hypothetical protein
MRLFFKVFDSKMASREKLFKAAVEFANQIGRDRLMTLSHSEDRDNIVITIWYWAEEELKPQDMKRIAAAQTARPGAATPRPGGAELPIGLSGGFSALPKNFRDEEDEATLSRTPDVPPTSMDESKP